MECTASWMSGSNWSPNWDLIMFLEILQRIWASIIIWPSTQWSSIISWMADEWEPKHWKSSKISDHMATLKTPPCLGFRNSCFTCGHVHLRKVILTWKLGRRAVGMNVILVNICQRYGKGLNFICQLFFFGFHLLLVFLRVALDNRQ